MLELVQADDGGGWSSLALSAPALSPPSKDSCTVPRPLSVDHGNPPSPWESRLYVDFHHFAEDCVNWGADMNEGSVS
jgi:hypothetical protein